MVLFLCSCGFLDAVSWARCLFAHPFICSFIPSFIIICVLSTCCADAVLISGEREKSVTGTAPTSWILQALAASPQRTDQAIAALRATLVAQSVKGLQVAPENGEIGDFSSAPGGHVPSKPLLQHPGLGGILPPITCDPRKVQSVGSGNLCGDTSSVGPCF